MTCAWESQEIRGPPGSLDERVRGHHASCLTFSGRSGSGWGSARSGEQLVQDCHPHHYTGLDLRGDHRLRRVDDLAGELHAAVDRPRVHQHLARAQPPSMIWYQVAYSRNDGRKLSPHPLVLHPQRIHHVGPLELVEREADLQPSVSIPRGISVGGPARVTFAPISAETP